MHIPAKCYEKIFNRAKVIASPKKVIILNLTSITRLNGCEVYVIFCTWFQ